MRNPWISLPEKAPFVIAPSVVIPLDMGLEVAHTVAVDTGLIDRPLDTSPVAAGILAHTVDMADRVVGMIPRAAVVAG
jgi:hypothetical protein